MACCFKMTTFIAFFCGVLLCSCLAGEPSDHNAHTGNRSEPHHEPPDSHNAPAANTSHADGHAHTGNGSEAHHEPPDSHNAPAANTSHADGHAHTGNGSEAHHGIHVASWNFDYVRQPLIISVFLLVAAVCKLVFHHANILSSIVPESCLLIILGTVVGAVLHFAGADRTAFAHFSSQLFFLYLLPPIILESAYSLHDRVFFENLGTILLYAVVGTILNCFLVGALLYGLSVGGAMGSLGSVHSISLLECLVFSALIAAVDPVAVLAIFQEIGVNNVLYFLVFGESLLNDAVTVVLYNMMKAFSTMESIPPTQVGLGFAAFLTVSLGGLAIGILLGAISSWFTKYSNHVRVVEPLAIFGFAYSSYLLAELFHFSGIISIIGCGLMQAQYAFHNISHKSYITVTYFSKVISTTCDCIIFMFLGLALVRDDHAWHTGFILWTVFLCLIIRFIGVYSLTFIANRVERLRTIDWEEQFIMAYGGLRGAVAFSLVAMLDQRHVRHQSLFETATLAVIIFTVFVQGITIKPLVKLLRIQSSDEKVLSIFDEFNCHVTDHVMAGIEEILGYRGSNFVRELLDYYDGQYFKKWLQRDPQTKDDQIMEFYQQIALQLHYENVSGAVQMERYSSEIQLYNRRSDDEEVTGVMPLSPHPEILNWSLDQYLRRKSVYPDVDPRRRRSSALPPSITEQKDKLPDSDAEDAPPTPVAGKRRRSSVLDLFMRKPDDSGSTVKDNPTVDDIRQWLVKNPKTEIYRHAYDKNLVHDPENDLLHHIHEKQRRTSRFRQARLASLVDSSCTLSPALSMEAIPHHTRLDMISEDTAAENKSSPTRKRHPAVLNRSQTVDTESVPYPTPHHPCLGPSTARPHLSGRSATIDHSYLSPNDPILDTKDKDVNKDHPGKTDVHSLEAILEEDNPEVYNLLQDLPTESSTDLPSEPVEAENGNTIDVTPLEDKEPSTIKDKPIVDEEPSVLPRVPTRGRLKKQAVVREHSLPESDKGEDESLELTDTDGTTHPKEL